jgi:hypothetical protein
MDTASSNKKTDPLHVPSPKDLDNLVLRERLSLVHHLTAPGLIVSIMPVLAVWWLVRDIFPGPRSYLWLMGSLAFVTFRIFVGRFYTRSKADPASARWWSIFFTVCSGAMRGQPFSRSIARSSRSSLWPSSSVPPQQRLLSWPPFDGALPLASLCDHDAGEYYFREP